MAPSLGAVRSKGSSAWLSAVSSDLTSTRPSLPPEWLADAVSSRPIGVVHRRQLFEGDPLTDSGDSDRRRFLGAVLDLEPDRAQRSPLTQAIRSRGPEAAASVEAVIRPPPPGLVLEAVFALVVGDDEQDVVLVGVAVVLEVGDVGGDLLAHPLQRLGGPIPLELEEDPPSVGAVDPTPIRSRNRLLDLARPPPALLADLLLTTPDLETLAAYLSAAAPQGTEE